MPETLSYDHPKYPEFARLIRERVDISACDGTHDISRAILKELDLDVETSLVWIADNGGCCCDCEIIYNVLH